jgi:hypothetical protein
MESRDYLKDEIERMTRVLAKLLAGLIGAKNSGEVNLQIKLTENVFKNQLDIDIQNLIALENEDFLSKILSIKKMSIKELECLSDIIFELGKIKVSKEYSNTYFEKSLLLYSHIVANNSNYSFEWNNKIENIKKHLATSN